MDKDVLKRFAASTKVNRREVGSVPMMFGWDGMEMRLSIRILYLLGKYCCLNGLFLFN